MMISSTNLPRWNGIHQYRFGLIGFLDFHGYPYTLAFVYAQSGNSLGH